MPKKQSFLDEPSGQNKRHLCIVITDANSENEYLVVPVDTLKFDFQDKSCVLHVGDHSFIKQESFVNYRFAKVISFTQLYNGLQHGFFIRKEDVSDEVLARIQKGARETKNLKTEIKDWFELF